MLFDFDGSRESKDNICFGGLFFLNYSKGGGVGNISLITIFTKKLWEIVLVFRPRYCFVVDTLYVEDGLY